MPGHRPHRQNGLQYFVICDMAPEDVCTLSEFLRNSARGGILYVLYVSTPRVSIPL
jgi:hypothetical protein